MFAEDFLCFLIFLDTGAPTTTPTMNPTITIAQPSMSPIKTVAPSMTPTRSPIFSNPIKFTIQISLRPINQGIGRFLRYLIRKRLIMKTVLLEALQFYNTAFAFIHGPEEYPPSIRVNRGRRRLQQNDVVNVAFTFTTEIQSAETYVGQSHEFSEQ